VRLARPCRIRAKSRPRLQAVAGISMTELITPMLPLSAVGRRRRIAPPAMKPAFAG
jgi:hypothetical protein